jgi:hypothetical protein
MPIDPRRRAMADALREIRALLARPDNDFLWSSWEDADVALAEIDGLLASIEGGAPLGRSVGSVLFAPTGPIQEVALGSGWGDEFIAIADRWDAASRMADFIPPEPAATECRCVTPPLDYRDYDRRVLGVDEAGGRHGDVAIDRCKRCGREWLVYHYENEAFSRSGRWYRGIISPEQEERVTPANALAILAELPWHLYGGSHYETSGKRSDRPLDPGQV